MAYQSSYIPTVNTQLYYKLNGGATDDSGNGNNGTATNVTYVDGRFGQGASFNGTSSYIQTTGAVTTGTSATFSFWVKLSGTQNQGFLSEQAYGSNAAIAIDGGLLFYIFGSSNILQCATLPMVGQWSNVLVTHSGTTSTIYIDGIQRATGTVNAKTSSGTSLVIGTLPAVGYYTNGQMDEIIVENRAWTFKEIQQYYTNAIGRYQTNII